MKWTGNLEKKNTLLKFLCPNECRQCLIEEAKISLLQSFNYAYIETSGSWFKEMEFPFGALGSASTEQVFF